MANKYTRKGQGREALPAEDEFVSFWDKAWIAVKPHLRLIGYGAGALVAVSLVVWIVGMVTESSREAATEAFARAVRVHEAELLADDATDKDKDGKPADGDEVPRFKTAKERAEATLAELDKLQKENGGTAVSKQALAFRAGVLFELGRYDEARQLAAQFAAQGGKQNPLLSITREQEGLALESQGKLDEALKIYADLADRGDDFFRERALFDKARVMAKKGDVAGAKDAYKKIVEKTQAGALHDEAQNRLAILGG